VLPDLQRESENRRRWEEILPVDLRARAAAIDMVYDQRRMGGPPDITGETPHHWEEAAQSIAKLRVIVCADPLMPQPSEWAEWTSRYGEIIMGFGNIVAPIEPIEDYSQLVDYYQQRIEKL